MSKTQIHRGKVKVGDAVIRDPSYLFDAESSDVFYKGEKVCFSEYFYIVMNKPKGVLSASVDNSCKTVLDILPQEMRRKNMFPVGRLDKDTTGLLIITDDGQFAHKCIAPSKTVEKCYLVTLDGEISPELIDLFKKGVTLADGTVCRPAKLNILGKNTAELTITEGKYHQIKRMFGVADLGVTSLKRIRIGEFSLPDELCEGDCRYLNADEIEKLLI